MKVIIFFALVASTVAAPQFFFPAGSVPSAYTYNFGSFPVASSPVATTRVVSSNAVPITYTFSGTRRFDEADGTPVVAPVAADGASKSSVVTYSTFPAFSNRFVASAPITSFAASPITYSAAAPITYSAAAPITYTAPVVSSAVFPKTVAKTPGSEFVTY